jgi:hypothetical protein
VLVASCAAVETYPLLPGMSVGMPHPAQIGGGFSKQYSAAVRPGEKCVTVASIFGFHEYYCLRGTKVVKLERGDAAMRDPDAATIDLRRLRRKWIEFALLATLRISVRTALGTR